MTRGFDGESARVEVRVMSFEAVLIGLDIVWLEVDSVEATEKPKDVVRDGESGGLVTFVKTAIEKVATELELEVPNLGLGASPAVGCKRFVLGGCVYERGVASGEVSLLRLLVVSWVVGDKWLVLGGCVFGCSIRGWGKGVPNREFWTVGGEKPKEFGAGTPHTGGGGLAALPGCVYVCERLVYVRGVS